MIRGLCSILAVLACGPAMADEEAPAKPRVSISGRAIVIDANGKRQEIELGNPRIPSKMIVIGPDGKKQEVELGKGWQIPESILKEMPKEVRERLENAMKKGAGFEGRGIFIGPDGVRKEFRLGEDMKFPEGMFKGMDEEMRAQIEKIQQDAKKWSARRGAFPRGTIIGPDGKWHSLDKLPKDVRVAVEKALEDEARAAAERAEKEKARKKEQQSAAQDEIQQLREQLEKLQERIERLEKKN